MQDIGLGTTLEKPLETQEQCDAYVAMAQAVNEHNSSCTVGDTLWSIEEEEACYKVADGGVVQEPADPSEPEPTMEDRMKTLEEQNETLKEESKMLKQCLLEMSETVYA